jgi:hypothetical protein
VARQAAPTRSGYAVRSSKTEQGRAPESGIHHISTLQKRILVRKRIASSAQRPTIAAIEYCDRTVSSDLSRVGRHTGRHIVTLLCHQVANCKRSIHAGTDSAPRFHVFSHYWEMSRIRVWGSIRTVARVPGMSHIPSRIRSSIRCMSRPRTTTSDGSASAEGRGPT